MITLTRHAEQRMRQRIGIPKAACRRLAEKAFRFGARPEDATPLLRQYLDRVYLEMQNCNQLRVYKAYIYVFHDFKLITVLHVPKKRRPIETRVPYRHRFDYPTWGD